MDEIFVAVLPTCFGKSIIFHFLFARGQQKSNGSDINMKDRRYQQLERAKETFQKNIPASAQMLREDKNLSAAGVLLSVLLTVKTFKDARVFWSRYSFTNSLYGSPGYFVQQSKVSGSKNNNITKRRSMQGNQDVKQRT